MLFHYFWYVFSVCFWYFKKKFDIGWFFIYNLDCLTGALDWTCSLQQQQVVFGVIFFWQFWDTIPPCYRNSPLVHLTPSRDFFIGASGRTNSWHIFKAKFWTPTPGFFSHFAPLEYTWNGQIPSWPIAGSLFGPSDYLVTKSTTDNWASWDEKRWLAYFFWESFGKKTFGILAS